jgi:hypothetical protein
VRLGPATSRAFLSTDPLARNFFASYPSLMRAASTVGVSLRWWIVNIDRYSFSSVTLEGRGLHVENLGFVAGSSIGNAGCSIDRLRTRPCPRAAYSMIEHRPIGGSRPGPWCLGARTDGRTKKPAICDGPSPGRKTPQVICSVARLGHFDPAGCGYSHTVPRQTGGQLNREIMIMALAFPATNCPGLK